MKLRTKYTYQRHFGSPEHMWTCIGREGGLHLHITDYTSSDFMQNTPYSGGLEVHYRSPPEYMEDDAPSHDHCWLLQCPCWHDGTSLYVSEVAIPFWLTDPTNIERMLDWLEREYKTRFAKEESKP